MAKKELLELTNHEHIASANGENINARRIGLYGYDYTNSQWRRLAVDANGSIGGGGASTSEPFVTIGNTTGLSAERALIGTTNQITVTDNGANSTVVLSTPQDIAASSSPTFANLTLTGVGKFAAGSASAPSIAFADNLDTGFYEQTTGASGNIALTINASEAMRWNSSSSWGWHGTAPSTANVITSAFTSTASALGTYLNVVFTYSPTFGFAPKVTVLDFTAKSTVNVGVQAIVSKAELATSPANSAISFIANPVISTAVSSGTRTLVGYDFAPSAGATMTGGTVNMYGFRVPTPPTGYSGSGGTLNYYSYYSDAGHIILNESGGDYDVRIEGDTNANLFFLDASADAIGIGLNNPTSMLDVANDVRARQLIAGGDNAGVAATTSLTNATDTNSGTSVSVFQRSGNATSAHQGWIKVYVGTAARYIPVWD